jgi:hypothetical protein
LYDYGDTGDSEEGKGVKEVRVCVVVTGMRERVRREEK